MAAPDCGPTIPVLYLLSIALLGDDAELLPDVPGSISISFLSIALLGDDAELLSDVPGSIYFFLINCFIG